MITVDLETTGGLKGILVPVPKSSDRIILVTLQDGSQVSATFISLSDKSLHDFVADLSTLEHNPQVQLYSDVYKAQCTKKVNKTYGPPRIGKRGKKLKW